MKEVKLLLALFLCCHLAEVTVGQVGFSLKESIAYGLQNHSLIKIGDANQQKALEKKKEIMAAYLPQVNLAAGLDNNIVVPSSVFPAIPIKLPNGEVLSLGGGVVKMGQKYSANAAVQLDQQIYNQQIIVGLSAVGVSTKLSELEKQKIKNDLIYNIASSYFKIMLAQKKLQLLLENKTRMEELVRVVKLRAEQGIAKKVDVMQVELNLNNLLSQISVAENSYLLSMNVFKTNMGLNFVDNIVLTDTAKWLSQTPEEKVMPIFYYENSTDYALQKTQIELLELNKKNIKAGAYPVLSAYARYGLNGFGEKIDKVVDPLHNFSAIGIKFSWNVFDGTKRSSQYKQANYDIANAKESLLLNERVQNVQFESAKIQMMRTWSMLKTNRENLYLSRELYANTSLQYKQGFAQLSDLLNVEMSTWSAQDNYTQSLLDYYTAELEINKANGTLENYFNQL